MPLTTIPTICTKCGRPIIWTDPKTITDSAQELYDGTAYPWNVARAYEAIGAAGAHMRMLASMLSGVCVPCHLGANLGATMTADRGEARPALHVVREPDEFEAIGDGSGGRGVAAQAVSPVLREGDHDGLLDKTSGRRTRHESQVGIETTHGGKSC